MVCERHCGRAVLMCEPEARARSDRPMLAYSIGGSETPIFGCGGWGNRSPSICELQQLGGDARKRLTHHSAYCFPFVSQGKHPWFVEWTR
jgi:hypothetical protein